MIQKQLPLFTQIQRNTLNRALSMIKATGCQFKIIAPNGEEYGELEVRSKKGSGGHKYTFKYTGYAARVAAEKIGVVEVFETPDEAPPASYRAAIASTGIKLFGKGSYTTCIEGNVVQGLRLF